MNEQQNNPVVYDVDNEDTITQALMDLLNSYPGLPLTGETEIQFAKLDANGGISMFPTQAPVVERERKYIYGLIEKDCQYLFFIVFRAAGLSSARKVDVKEWLDTLGRWLEQQTVTIGGVQYKLVEYPTFESENHLEIKSIERRTASYLDSTTENMVETWAIGILVRYTATYQK